MKRMLASVLALAVTIGGSFTLIPAAYAQTAAAAEHPVPPAVTLGFRLAVATALPTSYTVRPGDTLAGIAGRYCGHVNDWTGFYHQNEKVIGADPNLIVPGQVLNLTRCTDPPSLLHLGSAYHATARHAVRHAAARGGKVRGVTYGYPNYCGDGDGDGWDVPCTLHHHAAAVRLSGRHSYRAVSASRSYAGHYSYAGLEALWVSAGGPAWAAAHAAEIAECESGGNVSAHNPSGAAGLWQILGSVVGGNLYNPYVNAANAVAKFKASGDTFAQWVCK